MNVKYDSLHFTGRIFVVTGSSRGIGWEFTRPLMAAGASVGITGGYMTGKGIQ